MTTEERTLLQRTQLKLARYIHRLCVENNIRYYIIGGTAIGAKRHGGFIPWDIDIDIEMPREDYERFKELCKTELDDRFSYHDYSNTKDIYAPHAVVCIKDTILRTSMVTLCDNEIDKVFVDVFPLDVAPESPRLQKKQAKKIRMLRALKAHKVGVIFRGTKKEVAIKRFLRFLLTPFSFKWIGTVREKVMRKYENCNSGLVSSMTSRYSYEKHLMPFEVYGKPTLVKFEDTELFAPEKLDEFLTRIYGDYMKLPPVEEREGLLDCFTEVYVPEEIQKGEF